MTSIFIMHNSFFRISQTLTLRSFSRHKQLVQDDFTTNIEGLHFINLGYGGKGTASAVEKNSPMVLLLDSTLSVSNEGVACDIYGNLWEWQIQQPNWDRIKLQWEPFSTPKKGSEFIPSFPRRLLSPESFHCRNSAWRGRSSEEMGSVDVLLLHKKRILPFKKPTQIATSISRHYNMFLIHLLIFTIVS